MAASSRSSRPRLSAGGASVPAVTRSGRWVRLDAEDRAGRERLAHYMLRCPFSLERLIRVTDQGKVIYVAEKKACRRFPKPAGGDLFGDVDPGVARNFQVFDPLDFIAELTQHIPDARKHLVRYFGFYSNKSRGMISTPTISPDDE